MLLEENPKQNETKRNKNIASFLKIWASTHHTNSKEIWGVLIYFFLHSVCSSLRGVR